MSLNSLTFEQLVDEFNSGKTYGNTISLEFLRKVCVRGKLTDNAVHFLLHVYLNGYSSSEQFKLLRSLIRNQYISLDSKLKVLEFLIFEMNPMKDSTSKKKALAVEVLKLCKNSPESRLKALSILKEIKLKGIRQLATRDEYEKLSIVSQESSVLKGITTRDYSKHKSESSDAFEEKYIISTKTTECEKEKQDITFNHLSAFFRSESKKAKSIENTMLSRLDQPWGIDMDSILWLLRNLANFNSIQWNMDIEEVEKFILHFFPCKKFFSRFTSKPLLRASLELSDYQEWQNKYGRSFLLSERNFVPSEMKDVHNSFQEFIKSITPSDLFLRKTYGLRYSLNDRSVYSFLYFLKTPDLNKRKSGKYLIVFFYGKQMPVRLSKFLGMQDILEYSKTHLKISSSPELKILNCYVKECNSAEQALEILALLQFEVPFQYLNNTYTKLYKIEVRYTGFELEKRKKFLELLNRKKIAINRARNRESDIHCINCNQPLTDRLSRLRGYGPECWRKLKHLNLSPIDLSASPDVFERYATHDFEGWLRLVRSLVKSLT